MPVQATELPAGAAGDPQHTPATETVKAQQLNSKAPKRKRSGTTAEASVASFDHDAVDAAAAEADAATAAKKRQQRADVGLVDSAQNSQLQEKLSEAGLGSDKQLDSGEGEESDSGESEESQEGSQQPRSHPYGVQPWGNFYLTQVPEIRTAGGCYSGGSWEGALAAVSVLQQVCSQWAAFT